MVQACFAKGAQIQKSIKKRLYTLAACEIHLTSTPWGLMMPRRPPVGLKYILQTAMVEIERQLPAASAREEERCWLWRAVCSYLCN